MRRKTSLAVALVLAAALAVVPAGTVGAASTFTFYGSGFGHGVGMSQWGAFGLAGEGWSHRKILKHFYSGTKVQKASSPPRVLRIGLAQGYHKLTLTAMAGPVDLRVSDPKTGTLVGTIPGGRTWTVRSVSNKYRVLDDTGAVVGGRLWGGRNRDLYANYVAESSRLTVGETGHTYNRGFIEFNLYQCGGGCIQRLVLVIAPQPYLFGVAEVSSSWPTEALQAQVDASRSYAFFKASSGQHRAGCNCALYATSADQVYAGWDKEGGADGDKWVAAARKTSGQVVTHGGHVIEAFFMASDGGHTEDNENVFGGSPIAYLRGVCDPGDFVPENTSRVWTASFSAAELTSALGLGIGTIQRFADFRRGVSGRIITVRAIGGSGNATISGTTLRTRLGLRDDKVWVNHDKNIVGTIRTKYDNLNCAPGLPTSTMTSVPGGLRQKFQRGGIYRNSTIGVSVWLKGAVYSEYLHAGGAAGVLGLPISDPASLSGPTGCHRYTCTRAKFEHGSIYFKGPVGAHELHGPVLGYYLSHGGAGGSFGFPTSDVRDTGTGGHYANFEHGTITCSGGVCSG